MIENLPIGIFDQSATVIDGVPIFCGGQSNYHVEQGCYTYNVETGTWQMVRPGPRASENWAVCPLELYFVVFRGSFKVVKGLFWLFGGPLLFPSPLPTKLKA